MERKKFHLIDVILSVICVVFVAEAAAPAAALDVLGLLRQQPGAEEAAAGAVREIGRAVLRRAR